MRLLSYREPDFAAQLTPLLERSAFAPEIEAQVAAMLAQVRQRGDAALVDYARQFDKVELTPAEFRVPAAELAAAAAQVAPEVREAIALAHANVTAYARQQAPRDWTFNPRPGVTVGERFVPLQRVAAYIPGGTAPLVSTVLHTITMAQVAGVPEIVVLSPCGPDRRINPAILYAAQLAGATEVYRLGGVYGIAAMAYGTATVRRVEKIVGPGNAYVTAAKRQVYGQVALDLVAGPSEILIIADHTARPAHLAADLLSQAEHGSGYEQAVLVSTDEALLQATAVDLERQKATLPKEACVDRVLAQGTWFILVRDLEQACEMASRYAPEHLEIHTAEPAALLPRITAAGAIFLGPWTPEPVGDFVAGPSHVLPTGGAARYFSGLTAHHFYRRISTVQYDEAALRREGPAIEAFARVEQLAAHGRTVAVRFNPGSTP